MSRPVRIAVTTVVRRAPLALPSGHLRMVDLDSGAQLASAPVPDAVHRALDANPRGGLRGGRGLVAAGDRLAMAVHDRVLLLGPDWRAEQIISHPWMGGVHDIAAVGDGLWATCADNDLVLKLDWEGNLVRAWHWRANPELRRALGLGWLPGFESDVDHRHPFGGGLRLEFGHVNALAVDGDSLLVGLGLVRPPMPLARPLTRALAYRIVRRSGVGRPARAAVAAWAGSGARARLQTRLAGRGTRNLTPGGLSFAAGPQERPGWNWAIVALDNEGARLVVRRPVLGLPVHNVATDGDRLVVNDSPGARVIAVDPESGEIVRAVPLPGQLPFPRGLLRLGPARFIVGVQQPAALKVVNLDEERIECTIPLPDAHDESPYAIAPVPEGFADPAGALPTDRSGWGIPGADASR